MQLIIDTDVGVDDAQAIMLALTHPGLTVEAITAVSGNTTLDNVVRNIFTVLDVMQAADIPVYRGAECPLLPDLWERDPNVHGGDGLGDLPDRPPTHREVEAEPAAVALVRLANESPGELTLIALGPLTNIALACRLDPDFPQKIKQFVFMGGTISAFGNTRIVTAEFNVHCDPEAAYIVLDAFPQSVMLSWETTMQHAFPWEQYDALAAIPTAAGRFFRDTSRTTRALLQRYPQVPGYLLPDPLAMAILLDPDLIQASSQHYVTVELNGRSTRGQTVIDYLGLHGREPNVEIITGLDTGGVYAMFERALS
ncbi:MAG: nucleoside hydrolase [Anaerolineae bacterium]|jgi:purine nucleosidase|nr:nucleoside hydrolase [Anaerolineae bacterium]